MDNLEETSPLNSDQEQESQQYSGEQERQQPAEEPPWPTNGGPLGCLLGAVSGVLVGGFLGTTLLIPYRLVGITLTVLLTIGLAILGWQIGRRIFREYKPPKVRPPKERRPKQRRPAER